MRKSNAAGAKRQTKRDGFRLRAGLTLAALLLWFLLLGGRLVQLTLFTDQRVVAFSERQGEGSVNIDLPRGMIFDRNMRQLAVSIQTHSLYLNPSKVKHPRETAQRLARILEPKNRNAREKLRRKLVKNIIKKKSRQFIWVRRKVSDNLYAAVRKAGIEAIGFAKEAKRFYPKRDIAARIIGYAGMDDQGLYGVEYKYDSVIRPHRSRFTVLKDALGRPVSMPDAVTISEQSTPRDLVLTIDERIQYVAEEALSAQVQATGARRGIAIVMEPHSGEVLAVAESPKLDPNSFSQSHHGRFTSGAVARQVEPGSTFKLFVAAAALERNLVYPAMIINCEKGRYRVGAHTFKEASNHQFENLTVSEVIEKSSNIGAIKIGEKLGQKNLYSALRSFGFGQRAGVDLPGESSGLLRPVKDWSTTSLPAISFGQEVAVTPMQLITGISVFANGGDLVRPHLVRAFARGGAIVELVKPKVIRKVISTETARIISAMMVGVVERGTGKRAAVPGFAVAGKSGTAQKFDREKGEYSADMFLSSFGGFFPAHNPRLAILVMIDEPKGVAWGGYVAGPVFAEIAARSARILRLPSADTDVWEIDWNRVVNAKQQKTALPDKVDTHI